MCGIVGISSSDLLSASINDATVALMLKSIQSRGPDDSGIWKNPNTVLGHNRLAIMDLSEAGRQPMLSDTGRYVIVYNGEIYNVVDIKSELPTNLDFNGHSDTEIILHAIDQWGIEVAVPMLRGMFAFAIYDKRDKLLHLVRDPAGIKPLYYSYVNESLFFSSQIKCFLEIPSFKKEICKNSLELYLKYNYIPAPHTIYKNCYKQKPGTILTFQGSKLLKEISYWSLKETYLKNINSRIYNFEDACEIVENELSHSVKNQLVADVPVGVFLSGGIDSSLITALASKHSKNIKTFSIGFDEPQYDEAPFAKQVANILGTNHYEHYLTINDALKIIEDIPKFCDEPLGDASQVPTFLISQITRKEVTVALSGDGGDELFFGYSRYKDIETLRKIQQLMPTRLSSLLLNITHKIPFIKDDISFKCLIAKQLIKHNIINEQYDALFNFWPELTSKSHNSSPALLDKMHSLEYMPYHDMHLYLVDDILTKVDRCSMYNSLETRLPFLDHQIIELSSKLPISVKYKDQKLKAILKKILSKYIQPSIFERPKKGFALPIDLWLRGPLKDWGYSLIEDIKNDGILDHKIIKKYMQEHISKKTNLQYSLWNIFMWQHWRNYYK